MTDNIVALYGAVYEAALATALQEPADGHYCRKGL